MYGVNYCYASAYYRPQIVVLYMKNFKNTTVGLSKCAKKRFVENDPVYC